MKKPDQNNLPKSKNKAEQIKQQPKLERKSLDKIFAGIQALPVIKAIGSKFEKQKPTPNTSKSDAARAELEFGQKRYDAAINAEKDKLNNLSDNLHHFDEDSASKIQVEVDHLEKLKAGQSDFYTQKQIPAKERMERSEFAQEHPLEELKTVEKEYNDKFNSIQDSFDKATTSEEKAKYGAQMNQAIEDHQKRTEGLKQMDANNKQQKLEAQNLEKENKIAEQKRLDDSIKDQFKKSMDESKAEDKIKNDEKERKQKVIDRAKNIKSIRKERIADEKFEEKAAQEDYESEVITRAKNIKEIRKNRIADEKSTEKQEQKAKKDTLDKKERQKRLKGLGKEIIANETKWDDEVEKSKENKAKSKDKFSKAKDRITGAFNKLAEKLKVDHTKEPALKGALKSGTNKIKGAIDKIKKSLEVDHNGDPLIPRKINELKSKLDASKIGRLDKAMEEGDKVISPRLMQVRGAIESKLVDIKSTEQKIAELKKEIKSETDPEYKDRLIDELNSESNALFEYENDVKQLKVEGIAIFDKEQATKSYQSPERQQQIESVNVAQNRLERLKIELNLKTEPLKAKIAKLNSSKSDKRAEISKIQSKINKIDQDFNKLIEVQSSIIANNQ